MRRSNDEADPKHARRTVKKVAAACPLLKGEDLDTLSRDLRVYAWALSCWHQAFLANDLAALTGRQADAPVQEDRTAAENHSRDGVEPRDLLGNRPRLREETSPLAACKSSK